MTCQTTRRGSGWRRPDEARFNMNGAELFGRVLRVNVARAAAHKLGASKAVWSADEWFKNLNEEGTPASH